MTKISIIIPIYNVESYLDKCLTSVVQQTFDDIEIICVDDASTDKSGEILKKYAQSDKRIKILKHSQNLGQSMARNNGLHFSSGEYVLFVDADDILNPNAVHILYEQAVKDDLDIIMYSAHCAVADDCNETNINEMSYVWKGEYSDIYSGMEFFSMALKNHENIGQIWNCMFRRELIQDNTIEFFPGIIYEDNLFFLQTMFFAKRVKCISNILYCYNVRPNSTMRKPITSYNLKSMVVLYCELLRFFKDKKFTMPHQNHAVKQFISAVYEGLGKMYDNASKSLQDEKLYFSNKTYDLLYENFVRIRAVKKSHECN